jgi:hypothetical protein
VDVNSGTVLVLKNGEAITDDPDGSGVRIYGGTFFTMEGGEIKGNPVPRAAWRCM